MLCADIDLMRPARVHPLSARQWVEIRREQMDHLDTELDTATNDELRQRADGRERFARSLVQALATCHPEAWVSLASAAGRAAFEARVYLAALRDRGE